MIQTYSPLSSAPKHHWAWVTLSGPDAKDFLHRLTTANVRKMAVGQGSSGCFLNAQGRVQSYFYLWNYFEGEYAFEFDAGQSQHWKAQLLSTIDANTFGEKMTLTDPSENLAPLWLFPDAEALAILDPENKLQAGQTMAIEDEIRICHHGDAQYGRPWITAWGRPARLNQWAERTFPDAQPIDRPVIDRWRIEANRPEVDSEITDQVMPVEVGIRDSIADNKGCYPGQEVIEKIIALGSPPRRLVQIRGSGPAPESQTPVFNLADPPVQVGKITSSYQDQDDFIAIGIFSKIHAKENLEVKLSSHQNGIVKKIAPYA